MAHIHKIELYLVEQGTVSSGLYPIEDMLNTAFPDDIIEIKSFESKDVGNWLEKSEFEEEGIYLEDLNEEFDEEGKE